jgi:hypothetical protein
MANLGLYLLNQSLLSLRIMTLLNLEVLGSNSGLGREFFDGNFPFPQMDKDAKYDLFLNESKKEGKRGRKREKKKEEEKKEEEKEEEKKKVSRERKGENERKESG